MNIHILSTSFPANSPNIPNQTSGSERLQSACNLNVQPGDKSSDSSHLHAVMQK